jgi:hypothetical protein
MLETLALDGIRSVVWAESLASQLLWLAARTFELNGAFREQQKRCFLRAQSATATIPS